MNKRGLKKLYSCSYDRSSCRRAVIYQGRGSGLRRAEQEFLLRPRRLFGGVGEVSQQARAAGGAGCWMGLGQMGGPGWRGVRA